MPEQNIVAHVEVPVGAGGSLDLDAMYTRLNLHCTYQKNMFPGLIYRPHASPVVLLCFFSGKIVITGGKTERDVMEGWRRLWPTLRVFVRPGPEPAHDPKRQRVCSDLSRGHDISGPGVQSFNPANAREDSLPQLP